MKKLDKFIFKSFLGPFAAILVVVVFILMMQFLWLYIDELVGKGLSFYVIFEFMMLGGCTILPLALPLATLLASMMTVGAMAENNELMAIKSAGISFARTIVPVLVCSVAITIGTFYISDEVVPRAFRKLYMLREDIGNTKDEIKIPTGTFYDGIEGYILRIEDRDINDMMHNVIVYDHTNGKGNTSLIIADSAQIKMSEGKDFLEFTLYNGANYSETNTKKYRDTTLELQKVDFIQQRMLIPLSNYNFEKSEGTKYSDQIKAMKLDKLTYFEDSLKTKVATGHVQHLDDMLSHNSFFRRKQLDTSFVTEGKTMFEDPSYMEWQDLEERISAYRAASEKCMQLKSTVESYNRDIYEPTYYLRRTSVEILKKYAGALACLILFLIGAPLGALIRKGGLATSAIISALFFVLYWVVDISGIKLAKDGVVSAAVGAFISAAVLLPIGCFLSYKAIRDHKMFSNNTFAAMWRKLTSRVGSFFKKKRIVFMGTPEFAVASLDALVKSSANAGYKVVGVVTVADKPSGRGLKVNESAVKKYAVEHSLPVLQPVKLKDPAFLEELRSLKADLFVVVAFRMLPEDVWKMPKYGTFNLHAALLPQYRGAAPINWAVINGEKITGATTFMIDKDIDTGGIIIRQNVKIEDTDTAGDVHDKLMPLGADMVVQTVEAIFEGNAETRVQRSFIQGAEVLKPAPKLTRELCHIDWNDTTKNVYNLIRGLSPFPTAFTEIVPAADPAAQPVSMKIFSTEKMELDSPAEPGTILSDGKTYLAVATQDGAISLKDIQLAGKKRMDVKAFLLGFRNPCEYRCTQGTSKAEIAKTKAS